MSFMTGSTFIWEKSTKMNIKNYSKIATIILVRFVFTESDREPINELNDRLKVDFDTKPIKFLHQDEFKIKQLIR